MMTKTKISVAAVAALATIAVMVMTQRLAQANLAQVQLRRENESLREQLRQAQALAQQPVGPGADAGEWERLRQGESELLRLRGELGLLRRQLAEATQRAVEEQARRIASNQALSTGIAQASDGTITLLAAEAKINGSSAHLENRGGQPNIGWWREASDSVQWSVQVTQPGKYRVNLTCACEPGTEGNDFVVGLSNQTLTGRVPATQGWDDYTTVQLGVVQLDQPGLVTLVVKPAGTTLQGEALMNLRSIMLLPD